MASHVVTVLTLSLSRILLRIPSELFNQAILASRWIQRPFFQKCVTCHHVTVPPNASKFISKRVVQVLQDGQCSKESLFFQMFTCISVSDEDELNRSKHGSGHGDSMRLKRDGRSSTFCTLWESMRLQRFQNTQDQRRKISSVCFVSIPFCTDMCASKYKHDHSQFCLCHLSSFLCTNQVKMNGFFSR